ncbi:hypothetical protein mRhiFer1_009779 [Rhinolophus ferrumequinum]|uniref:Uncharacterized protein n=1 Tax=Rhinolophus ferrumequinum TaxID=59479 RepID=A0A7J7ZCQ7_RHIFE|nr:hypothetical protein mRhiFer1_009779 [Rhinolophus ferrumequinum]
MCREDIALLLPSSIVNLPVFLVYYLYICKRNISFASLTSEWQQATPILLDNIFFYLIFPQIHCIAVYLFFCLVGFLCFFLNYSTYITLFPTSFLNTNWIKLEIFYILQQCPLDIFRKSPGLF